jgi:hypothetical protein
MPRDSPLPRREGSICLSDRRVELEDQIKALRKTAESEGWHVDRDAILLRIRDENGQRLQPLGSGSMGVVHRAELQGRGFVAAKSARSDLDLVQDLQAREDLLSEIAVLRRVGAHPHVVAFLGANLTSDAPMLLLQICEGGTVGDVFRRKRGAHAPKDAPRPAPADWLRGRSGLAAAASDGTGVGGAALPRARIPARARSAAAPQRRQTRQPLCTHPIALPLSPSPPAPPTPAARAPTRHAEHAAVRGPGDPTAGGLWAGTRPLERERGGGAPRHDGAHRLTQLHGP